MRAITVYCSSSAWLDPQFHDEAELVGRELARRRISLVYGGGSVGLMGELARSAKAAGGRVVGIITRALIDKELAWDGCDELLVTDTMRERKRLLMERGDAFVVLPGGVGTYEEFFEVLVGRQLGEHDKPIGIINAHGYYNPLIAMVQHGIEHRFIKPALLELFTIDPDPQVVIDGVLAPRPPQRPADARLLPMGPDR